MRQIKGFENAKMFRPGYAIEYDFFYPTQLKLSLETKAIEGLFFAGQINGTTGYEEAACQGLMAGINAHHRINEKKPFVLNRGEAYIGVLIDDLVNKGTKEPYRMFTSRAEYRILLRQDNADTRLIPLSHKIGTISDEEYEKVLTKSNNIKKITKIFDSKTVKPSEINEILEERGSNPIPQNYIIAKVLARPQISHNDLLRVDSINKLVNEYSQEEIEQVEILVKYKSYIETEKENVDRLRKMENKKISADFDYGLIHSLSLEAIDKLNKIKPESIGQASRISGVSPADISALLIYLNK